MQVEVGVLQLFRGNAWGNMARRLWAFVSLSLVAPPLFLLHGGNMSIFRGSMGRLKGYGWGDMRNEPCEVLDFQSQEQMWSLLMTGNVRRGDVVLAQAQSKTSGFLVDYCILPEALDVVHVNPSWRVTNTALTGEALEATRNIPRGSSIMQELPFIVACDRSDLSGSRARAVLHVLQAAQQDQEPAYSIRQVFEELTTGNLEEECMPSARRLVASGSAISTTEMARVLARWQSNCQRISVPPSSGLYRLHAKLQHSCKPNCAVGVLFSTGEVLVRALQDISTGELLTRNYEREAFLDLALDRRRQHLLQTRGFLCLCPRCLSEGGDEMPEYGGRPHSSQRAKYRLVRQWFWRGQG